MKIKIFFALLSLIALWLGCYAMEALSGTWAQFPAYITSLTCFFGGIIGILIVDIEGNK